MKCPSCNFTSIKREGNDAFCASCGVVIDDAPIVSELTFGESSNGGLILHGSFVAADQAGIRNARFQGESRENTLAKGKNRIFALASVLNIQDHISEQACRYFALAVTHNFVKGRRSQYVVSACLYVACRKDQKPIMLIDFADVLFCNVFAIGTTYLQLLKALHIHNLPLIDPSIYIYRFANKMEFPSEKNKQIMSDAVRLVQRMGKDWLHEGRRPAGIAAASLLLAARMNNERMAKTRIAYYAKVAEETLQRRLDEFRHTSAGRQTISLFRMTNVETSNDPPSFQKHRKRELEDNEKTSNRERNKSGIGCIYDTFDEHMIAMMTQLGMSEEEKKSLFMEDASEEVQNRAEKIIERYRAQRRRIADETASLLLEDKSEVVSMPSNETLSDLTDDSEIDDVILSKEEAAAKESVWMTMNLDYLQEQERKRLKIEADKAVGIYKEPKKRKWLKSREPVEPPLDAAESAKQMIQQRIPSKKINYEAFSNLFIKGRTDYMDNSQVSVNDN